MLQRAGEGTKTLRLIERLRALVLGTDDEHENRKRMHEEHANKKYSGSAE